MTILGLDDQDLKHYLYLCYILYQHLSIPIKTCSAKRQILMPDLRTQVSFIMYFIFKIQTFLAKSTFVCKHIHGQLLFIAKKFANP